MKRYHFNLLILFYSITIWSCGEEGIVDAPLNELSVDDGRALLYLSINESNFGVTVSTRNFDSQITFAEFAVYYDTLKFSLPQDNFFQTLGSVTPFYYHHEKETGKIYFSYNAGLGGTDTDLLVLNFQQAGSIEWVNVMLIDYDFKNNLGSPIYAYCTNSQKLSKNSCLQSGGTWGTNYDEFINGSVCYIDEGILVQAASGESFSLYEDTGNFVWSQAYCGYGP